MIDGAGGGGKGGRGRGSPVDDPTEDKDMQPPEGLPSQRISTRIFPVNLHNVTIRGLKRPIVHLSHHFYDDFSPLCRKFLFSTDDTVVFINVKDFVIRRKPRPHGSCLGDVTLTMPNCFHILFYLRQKPN